MLKLVWIISTQKNVAKKYRFGVKCDILFANLYFLYINFICVCKQLLYSANHF